MRRISPLLIVVLLSACTTISGISADAPVQVGQIMVEPQVQWARVKLPRQRGEVWTIDGLGLQELRFYMGVESDEPIMNAPDGSSEEMPVYKAEMLPDEIAELFSVTLTRTGWQQVETSSLAPAPFGNSQGFRFTYSMTSASGLLMRGVALAAKRGEELDLICFFAASEYYFDRFSPIAERVLASIRAA
jgi:hypothetical protein